MTIPQQATDHAFFESRRESEAYPEYLIYKGVSAAGLKAYRSRMTAVEGSLLVTVDAKVHFKDFYQRQGVVNGRARDIAALKRILGEYGGNPQQPIIPGPTDNFIKSDPVCRFCFLSTNGNSADPLLVTRPMLNSLLTHHQVMPNYLDFISVFGQHDKPQNLRFSSFRDQNLLKKAPIELASPSLGRSGQQYQMCYNLKSIAKMDEPLTDGSYEWRVRQAAIHHQFDLSEGKAVWIITQGRSDLRERVGTLFGVPNAQTFDSGAGCFGTTLDTHMMLCEWSTENWRSRLQYLEETVEAGTDRVVHDLSNKKIQPNDLLAIQLLEEKADETIMLLQANTEIIDSLRKFYLNLNETSFPLIGEVSNDIMTFTNQLEAIVSDCKLQVMRAQLLVRVASNRKALITQQLTAQASNRMEKMTGSMYNFSSMAQKETIAMKVIAFVTLFYLPATFVSTFFSTDVVKFQGATNFSPVAIISWVVATVILTALTGWSAWRYFKKSDEKRKQELKNLADQFSV